MPIISHIKKSTDDSWVIQTNEEHCAGVAKLSGVFASTIDMESYGRIMGLLHDKGKERKEFQQHIMNASGYAAETIIEGPYDHAYIGGILASIMFPRQYRLISNAIMGHHRGLYDEPDHVSKLTETIPNEITIPNIKEDLTIPESINNAQPKDIHHLERLLFSCLVDADYLDTESFMAPEHSKLRGNGESLTILLKKLESHLSTFNDLVNLSEVNQVRSFVQTCCRNSSISETGYYSLTVPTGGGKTLSSLLWALRHAITNNLKRVIIAIPYTSIISQTAATLKKILGDNNVLEHHSNIEFNERPADELVKTLQLATENWDYPIIVTTNIQLFESMFSNKPSRCRKLHNIAQSVIILDEVQNLPCDYLMPIVDAIDTYHRLFGCSFLFTTASMPILSGMIVGTSPKSSFQALPKIQEIIPTEANLHERIRRVRLSFDKEISTYDNLSERIAKENRVLCIVNTRKDARHIFENLPDEGIRIHLSRMMCPIHLNQTISYLKKALADPSIPTIRVISTQLIEAGVDIDFPVVYRQVAGLDSILQAAGRCNREGKMPMGTTYIFRFNKPLPKGFLTQTNNAREGMGQEYDWFSQEAMNAYFRQLFSRVDSFDKSDIKNLLYKPNDILFETAANEFNLINDNSIPVIVNWGDSTSLIDRWKRNGPSYYLVKALNQYCVNLHQNDFEEIQSSGAVRELNDGLFYIEDTSLYRNDIGLVTTNKWIEEILIA